MALIKHGWCVIVTSEVVHMLNEKCCLCSVSVLPVCILIPHIQYEWHFWQFAPVSKKKKKKAQVIFSFKFISAAVMQ